MITSIKDDFYLSWTEFLLLKETNNIFQTPEMYDAYNNAQKCHPFLIHLKNESGELEGVLLAVIQKEHSGILGIFTARSIIMGGPIVKDNDPLLIDVILKKYKKQIGRRVIYTQFRNMWDWMESKDIFIRNGFMYEPHLDILINLDRKFDEVEAGISKNKRRNVTKSNNKGVVFKEIVEREEVEKVEKVFELIKKTYRKIKLPLPHRSFFNSALEILAPKGYLKIFGVFFEGSIIGARVELLYNGRILDWYAGSDEDSSNLYPNDLLPFYILKWGTENNFKVFDFGGAGKPGRPYGVRDHKLKFGGDLVEFGRFEMVHKPLLMKIGKFGLKVYKLIHGIRQKQ